MLKLLTIPLLFATTLSFTQNAERDSLLQLCNEKGDIAYLEHGRSIIGMCSSPSDTAIINTVLNGVWRLVESCNASKDSCNRLKSKAEHVAIYVAGFARRVLKDPYKAEAVIEASTKRLMEIKDSLRIAGNYISLGIFKRNRAEYEGALKAYRQALEMYELIGDFNGAANCYHNISNVFSSMNNLEDAFAYQHKAIQLRTQDDLKSSLPYSWSAMCNLHNKSGSPDSCEFYLNKLINYDGQINKVLIALAYSNTGIAWANTDNYEKAKPYYFKSLEIREEIGNQSDIANSKINIGSMLMNSGDASKTEEYCLDGYDIAEKEDLLFLKMNACGCLYKYYEENDHAVKALKYYKLFNTFSDSLRNEEDRLNLSREQLKYSYERTKLKDSIEFAKIEELASAENARLQAMSDKNKSDLERKRAEQTILYGGLIIIVLFAVFIVNRLLVSRKQKLKLHEQNEELESQRAVLAEKNKEITDSIHYAKRIQLAVLPPKGRINAALPNNFVLYKPKDIVAGDFYWLESNPNTVLFAAADCTGHGVPGAMVSVVCNNGLNRSVREHGLTDPGQILDKTREIVVAEFEKSEDASGDEPSSDTIKDGMDIALCALEGNELKYAGANNPLWIIRCAPEGKSWDETMISELKAELDDKTYLEQHDDYLFIEVKADKQPIGKYDNARPYASHTLRLEKGDRVYLFSDGFADQFGGQKGKKMKVKNFKTLLLSIQSETISNQEALLDEAFENWKGSYEQLDDVCVIGLEF